ncbi:MAG: hypothetical protein FWE91_09140 [Defluviitaleaceae bacterium]|nr:hypothetical protein [Defluviitaleaceae bacterium]MCL2835783.1 hypothetical protein [Defluviitaleaceae bacterium]
MIWVTPLADDSDTTCDACEREKAAAVLHMARQSELHGGIDSIKHNIKLCKKCKVDVVEKLSEVIKLVSDKENP